MTMESRAAPRAARWGMTVGQTRMLPAARCRPARTPELAARRELFLERVGTLPNARPIIFGRESIARVEIFDCDRLKGR